MRRKPALTIAEALAISRSHKAAAAKAAARRKASPTKQAVSAVAASVVPIIRPQHWHVITLIGCE
jgi:hypothetical protein